MFIYDFFLLHSIVLYVYLCYSEWLLLASLVQLFNHCYLLCIIRLQCCLNHSYINMLGHILYKNLT